MLSIVVAGVCVVNCADPDLPAPVPATTAATSSANIMYINASPDAPALNFFVNNVASASNIGFLDASGYEKTPVGQASIKGVASDGKIGGTLDAAPILYRGSATTQNNFTFNNNASYTFIVTDSIARPKPATLNGTNPGGPQFLNLSDNLSAPAEGKAKVRIINVAAGLGAVYATTAEGEDYSTFNVNADKRPGIAYRAATPFVAVDAEGVHLELRTEESDGPVVISDHIDLEEGKIYTILLTGKYVKDTTDPIKVPYAITVYQHN